MGAKLAGGVTGWVPDVLPGYWQRTIPLGPDPAGEGEIVATLVRRGERVPTDRAVLAIHGYTDYFFHTEVADHFASRGFAFYALDLQKCGRSRRDGQTPHFITDLADYDTELERALAVISEQDESAKILVYGHSAGGLIVPLWLDRLRRRGATARAGVTGLVLNSPFLDLHGPAALRLGVTAAIGALSRVRTKGVVRGSSKGGYGTSLHRDYGGRIRLQPAVETVGRVPDHLGLAARRTTRSDPADRGLDVGVPNLILRSDNSVRETTDPAAMQCGDAVLDVTQIARWAGCIGNRTTIIPIADAKHDVFLSMPRPREGGFSGTGPMAGRLPQHAPENQVRHRRPGLVGER